MVRLNLQFRAATRDDDVATRAIAEPIVLEGATYSYPPT